MRPLEVSGSGGVGAAVKVSRKGVFAPSGNGCQTRRLESYCAAAWKMRTCQRVCEGVSTTT